MLSDGQRRIFRSSGYLPVGQVSAPEDVHALKAEAARLLGTSASPAQAPEDHLMRSLAPDGGEHVRVALHLCHLSEIYRAHALAPTVAAMIGGLFGEAPVVLTSLLFNKPAHVGEALALHQDLPYYPYLGKDDLITCWMALDEVGANNGGVEYLTGTHLAAVPHRQTTGQQALEIDPVLVDENRAVAVELAPGEAVFHHGLTVHRSAANRSGHARMGLATLYVRGSRHVPLEEFPYPVLRPRLGSTAGKDSL